MSKYDVNISEYVRIYNNKQGSEYVLYNTIQVNKYLLRDDCIQNPVKDLRAFWKKIIAFNYFRKTLQINSFENVQNVCRDLNMSWFWISRITQGLSVFVNITGFWTGVGIQLWEGTECSRIPNMPGFCICESYIRLWICLFLNMPGLRIWQGCGYARVTQGSEYAWISFHNGSNALICLNNAEYAWICLNVPD